MALKTTSRIARTKTEKVRSLVARLALMIAARENPGMYERYNIQRKKFLALKLSMIRKYTPAAVVAARKLLAAPPREAK